MPELLEFLTVVIVALPTALAVAHALELPGKLRLDERTYRAVQRMYYPGFTVGGYARAVMMTVGLLALVASLVL